MTPQLAADPENPILYVCVARGTTVLAELTRSSADAPHDGDENHHHDHLPSQLADQCLASAPRFHRHYSHTADARIYAFLMADPLVFFAIADDALLGDDKPIAPLLLLLLKRLRDSFSSSSVLRRRCSSFPEPLPRLFLQEDFLPELRRMVSSLVSQAEEPPPSRAFPNPPINVPLPSQSDEDQNRKNKRRKDREANMKMVISVVDRDIGDSDPGNGGSKSTPKLWSQYVRKIILIDLLVCSLLLVAWILVCRGFQCISH